MGDYINYLESLGEELALYYSHEKESKARISVIVKVSNAENYIETLLKSLSRQSFDEIEIVVINCNSDDNTNSIVSTFGQYDKRIRLINFKSDIPTLLENFVKQLRGDYILLVEKKCTKLRQNFLKDLYYTKFQNFTCGSLIKYTILLDLQLLVQKLLRKIFSFKDLDSHYVINLLGVQISIKHKCNFNYKEARKLGVDRSERSPKIIVSLTSYPARIKTVHYSINTLLQQSLKPHKVILWLAKSQFPNGEGDLPKELIELKKLGLDIFWCDDLKSYKKLIPALEAFPEDIIVTADDDLYYESDWLESLYQAYLEKPDCIHVQRACRVKIDNGILSPIPSRRLFYEYIQKPSFLNQLMGGSGCLFPPHSLYKDIFDKKRILSLIPTHDDIYFWVMAVLNRTKVNVVKGLRANLYCIEGSQEVGLCKINRRNNSGISVQEAYARVLKVYPQLLEYLKEELNED